MSDGVQMLNDTFELISFTGPLLKIFILLTCLTLLMSALKYLGRKGHLAARINTLALFCLVWTLTAGGVGAFTIPWLGLSQWVQPVWFGLYAAGLVVSYVYIANIEIGE